jgi:hypothetical protein
MFHFNRAMGVLFDAVKEEALNATLVQDDLLKARDVRNGVGDAVGALDYPRGVGVPETDLQHVIGFDPGAVAEFERVEDLQSAALEAVGLAIENLGVLSRERRMRWHSEMNEGTHLGTSLVDDSCLDAASAHPVCHH